MRIADRLKNKQNLLDQTGVTLIEMMVYMVIAGMLLGMAVTAFLGQNKSYNRQEVIAVATFDDTRTLEGRVFTLEEIP